MPRADAGPHGPVRILVLDHGGAVVDLARAAGLQVLGVTDRGRVLVDGPLAGLRSFTTNLGELLGQPVEVLPAGVRAHASGDHDLSHLTPLEVDGGGPEAVGQPAGDATS